MDDSTDVALGYFEASDAVSLRLTLSPQFAAAYNTLGPAQPFVSPGACTADYANSSYYEPPPGWESAPQIFYNVY
jgi:hypothetical protein